MDFLGDLTVQLDPVGLLVELPFLELFVVGSVELFLGVDSSFPLFSNCISPLFNHLSEFVLNKLVSLSLLTHSLFHVAFWFLWAERSERIVVEIHAGGPIRLKF